jgi:hypothetical protein
LLRLWGWPCAWRWPESNRLRQRLQGAPATLAVTPAGRLRRYSPRPAVFMVLTLWTCQLSRLYERPFSTVNSAGRNETAPEGLSLGRLRATACSRLPGNHSAGQDSRKPRRRIHVSGPLRRLARGHVSMVSRWWKPGNCIFRGIPLCVPGPGRRRRERLLPLRHRPCRDLRCGCRVHADGTQCRLLNRSAAGRPETGHSVR